MPTGPVVAITHRTRTSVVNLSTLSRIDGEQLTHQDDDKRWLLSRKLWRRIRSEGTIELLGVPVHTLRRGTSPC